MACSVRVCISNEGSTRTSADATGHLHAPPPAPATTTIWSFTCGYERSWGGREAAASSSRSPSAPSLIYDNPFLGLLGVARAAQGRYPRRQLRHGNPEYRDKLVHQLSSVKTRRANETNWRYAGNSVAVRIRGRQGRGSHDVAGLRAASGEGGCGRSQGSHWHGPARRRG